MSSYEIPGQGQGVEPGIPLDDVLALQSLAMGTFRAFARTKTQKRSPLRTSGFVLLHATTDPAELLLRHERGEAVLQSMNSYGEYDQPVDYETYLSVLVRKPDPRQWKFTISFLQYALTDEQRNSNSRSMYSFSWKRGDNQALGLHRRFVTTGRTVREHNEESQRAIELGGHDLKVAQHVKRQLISPETCAALGTLMSGQFEHTLGLSADFEEDAA